MSRWLVEVEEAAKSPSVLPAALEHNTGSWNIMRWGVLTVRVQQSSSSRKKRLFMV